MKSNPYWTDMTEEELSKDLEQLEIRGFRVVELSAVRELLRRYNNKKTECERLRHEVERLQILYPRLTDWEWFLRPYQAS